MAAADRSIIVFRNFVLLVSIWGLVFLSCVFFTASLVVVFLHGWKNFYKVMISYSLVEQFITFMKVFFQSWEYFLQNKESVSFKTANYFFPKLVFGTLFPVTIYGIILFKFRIPLSEWRPFKEEETAHGSAHWATANEVKKAGLRCKKGMLLGKYKDQFLVAGGYEHALLFAPTGSGKGVGFVVPNLLFWEESAIVHDVKLENYEKTSGYRRDKLKQKVFVWNPADQDGYTHCYNPMDWISKDIGKMVDDVQKISNFLVIQGQKADIWYMEANALVVGIMLYLLVDPKKIASLGEVLRVLRSDDVAYTLAVVLDTMGSKIHPVSYMNLASFLQKADKERSGVISTASSCLELWSNPLVDAATSKSHFNIDRFRKELYTLYVGVSPNNINRLRPLLQIFYQQCGGIFTSKLPDKRIDKFGVLMLLDEFPTLGKMEEIRMGIAYYRGYSVRLFLIIQDTEQLKSIYEASGMNSFLANSSYRITFAANNVETAQLISSLLGNKTIITQGYSRPKYLDLNPGARSVNISKGSRALLLPQEVINLPREEQILLVESQAPIRCKKICYYKEKFFTSKLFSPIKIPKQEPYLASRENRKKDTAAAS